MHQVELFENTDATGNRQFTTDIPQQEQIMISRIDHVSIAVRNYEKAKDFFVNILGAVPGTSATDNRLNFFWHVLSLGDLTRIELITPTAEDSFLKNFLKDKTDGAVHHVTLETPDIRETVKILDEKNVPYFGFNEEIEMWKEVFIHPKDAFGVLIQIAEFDPAYYLDDSVKLPPDQKWSVEKTESGCRLYMAHPGGGKASFDLNKEDIKGLIAHLETIQV